jgi:hypothetical protein
MAPRQGHPITPTYIFLAYYKAPDGTIATSDFRFDTALRGQKLSGIFRIVFYPLRPSQVPVPLCVFDVDGGAVTLNFADAAKTVISQIKLTAKIPCALAFNSNGLIDFKVEYESDQELPRCTKFEIDGLSLGGNSQDRLRKVIDDNHPIDLPFGNIDGTLIKNYTGFEILTELQFKNTPGNMNCRLTNKRRVRLMKRTTDNYYQPWFEVTETTTGECSLPERQFKLWSDSPSKMVRQQAPRTWRLVQRPAFDMDAGPTSPNRQKWILHIFGIPTYFVLREWEAWATEYRRSLRQVIGHRPVTFLPQFQAPATGNNSVLTYAGRWVVSFLISRSPDFVSHCAPLSIHLTDSGPAAQSLELQVSFPGIRDLSGHPLVGRAIKLVPTIKDSNEGLLKDSNEELLVAEQKTGIALNSDGPVLGAPSALPSVVRMGSLDLEFAGAATSQQPKPKLSLPGWMLLRPQGDITDVHIDLHFSISDLYPGGQDDPVGEEFVPERLNNFGALDRSAIASTSTSTDDVIVRELEIEEGFQRKSPLVIDLSRANAPSKPALPFSLRVMEDFKTAYNQVVRLNIISNSPAEQVETKTLDICADDEHKGRDVLVLDTNPFLVAKVHYLPFDQVGRFNSTIIAEWTTGDADAANWKLQFNQQPFCLTMPPAGVGEEMIKSKAYPTTLPIPFRFSTPTQLVLDPRTAPTLFAEAPWNLRRILGTPGQPFAGPLVKSLRYELLYGLSCDAEQPMVRLSEIFSRVGKIAARRDPEIQWPATKRQNDAYAEERLHWSKLYRQYLSRIAVLEPWNSILPSVDEKPALIEGATCWIRPYPDSDMQDPFNSSAGNLRGGATWGFESKNIYQTIFDNPDAGAPAASRKPAPSSSASVADLELSSLGGWGHQVAGFQSGLTKIYSDSSMGRTYRYKLERLGRIAVFWNLAKHVIVYERTVAPPKQFLTEEPALAGWPLIRKVREYVEILEDVRTYPDNPTFANSADQQLAERARGPIASCTFLKGAQISVSGAWGADVGTIGWRVPLWNPSTGRSDVYPKPKITLGIFSTVNEKPQIYPSEIDHPENVYFFTQTANIVDGNTSNKVDPDPHRWLPVPAIDFVNLERPVAPRGNFEAGDVRQIAPNESPVPGGFGPCTFQLVPAPVPANLVQDRGAPQPMSAVLETVSMSRSATGAGKLPANILSLQTIQNSTAAIFAEILKVLPSDAASVNSNILTAIKSAKDTQIATLQDTLSKGKEQLADVQSKIGAELQKIEQNAADNLKNQLVDSICPATGKGLLDEFQANANDILQNFDPAKAKAAVAQLQDSVDEVFLLVQSLPGATGQFVARYFDTAYQLCINVDKELTAVRSQMQDFTQIKAQGAVDDFLASFRSRFVSPLLNAGSAKPVDKIPDLAAYARTYLLDLTTGFESAALSMRLSVSNAKKADDVVASFKDSGFYKACVTYSTTMSGTSKLPGGIAKLASAVFNLSDPFLGTKEDLDTKLKLGETWKRDLVDEWHKKVAKWDPSDSAKFTTISQEAAKFLKEGLAAKVDTLKADIQSQMSQMAKVFAGEFDCGLDQLNAVGQKVETTLAELKNASVEQAREKLQKLRDDYSQQAEAFVNKSVRSLLPDDTVLQTGSQTLSLIRALGQPPKVPQLEFDREKIAYYFSEVAPTIDVTPVLARVHQAGEVLAQGQQVLDALKPLGMSVPVTGIFDQLLPAKLENFDLSTVLPNVAGLQLNKLFSGLKFPKNLGGDKVRVTHGLDQQSKRPYVRGDIDVQMTEVATVFTIGPVCLQVVTAHFQANTLVDVGVDGSIRRKVSGKISGQWRLAVSNQPIVTLKDTTLSFDDSGQIQFAVSPAGVELPGAMAFVSELAKAYKGKDSGLSIGLLPDGFQSVLKLPIPNTQAGTSGISNLTIGALFSVRFVKGQGFQLSVGFSLARPDAPFSLTVFILGGGGYLEALATYSPNTGQIGCEVSLSVTASASLAISLGPISGGVYVYLGMTGHFATGGPGLTLGMIVLIRGEVNILGIVSAAVSLLLEATYNSQSGELAGHGQLSISIKICWCFTLDINEEVHYTLGSNASQTSEVFDRPPANLVAALPGADSAFSYAMNADTNDDFLKYAKQYVAMLA